jgi:hypothetical protein
MLWFPIAVSVVSTGWSAAGAWWSWVITALVSDVATALWSDIFWGDGLGLIVVFFLAGLTLAGAAFFAGAFLGAG